jgi:hypothetical protein
MLRHVSIRFVSSTSIGVVPIAIFSAASALRAQPVMSQGFTTFINPGLMAQYHDLGFQNTVGEAIRGIATADSHTRLGPITHRASKFAFCHKGVER